MSLFDPCHALEQSHGSEAPSELLKSQEGEVLGPLWLRCLTWHMMALLTKNVNEELFGGEAASHFSELVGSWG